MKWRKFMRWGVAVCAIVVVAFLVWPRHEPRYGGRYLSAWLRDAARSGDEEDPRRAKAKEAVRRIGTNALPYLLENIRYQTPDWMLRAGQESWRISGNFCGWLQDMIEDRDRGGQARVGFEILGGEATPAIGELVGLMDYRDSPDRPADVLAGFGRVALPQLLGVLTNRAAGVQQRADAAYVLELMATNAWDTVVILIGCLADDPVVAGAAASALPKVATNATLIIGPLTNALGSPSAKLRSDVIDALGELGPGALLAEGAIRARLLDENEGVRESAGNALSRILGLGGEPKGIQ